MEYNKPNAKEPFFIFDIALIALRIPFKRSHKQTLVRPICLPETKVIPSDINKLSLDEDITIIGMGYIGKKGTKKKIGALKLQYAEMKRLSPHDCLRKHDMTAPRNFDSIKVEIKYSYLNSSQISNKNSITSPTSIFWSKKATSTQLFLHNHKSFEYLISTKRIMGFVLEEKIKKLHVMVIADLRQF